MPWKAPRLSDLRGRAGKDAEYARRRAADPALDLARRIRSSARWRKVRALKLARDPLCADCRGRGFVEAATQVHHLEPLARRPDLAYAMANLLSLCTACHARREAQERADRT